MGPISTAWPEFSVPWNTTIADQIWTGQGNNKGWIMGDVAGNGRAFSNSYDLNNGWDYCNGVPDTISPVKLLYR